MSAKKPSGKKKTSQDAGEKIVTKLETEITQLRQELRDKQEKLLRSYAELQNAQKRMEKESTVREEEIKKKYLSELIDLDEILKKAYEDKDPKQGLKLILDNLEKFFEKEQIKYIDCLGKPFDHTLHHAIAMIEKNDCHDGTIVEEIKKGYVIGDKLLRPSQVIVAKNKELDKKKGVKLNGKDCRN